MTCIWFAVDAWIMLGCCFSTVHNWLLWISANDFQWLFWVKRTHNLSIYKMGKPKCMCFVCCMCFSCHWLDDFNIFVSLYRTIADSTVTISVPTQSIWCMRKVHRRWSVLPVFGYLFSICIFIFPIIFFFGIFMCCKPCTLWLWLWLCLLLVFSSYFTIVSD